MRKTWLLSTALGAAVLFGAPAMAQNQPGYGSYGFDAPAASVPTPETPSGRGLIPSLQNQYQAARQAVGTADVTRLLEMSREAMTRGNWGQANEYLERAETSVLNRRVRGPSDLTAEDKALLNLINEAHTAMLNRERQEALRATTAALAAARDGGVATGAEMGTMPAQGGGMNGGMTGDRSMPAR